ncbi:efflux RND transporter periplasmic adaptor subunit [Phreatobacter sp. HK31-P]
MPLKRKIVVLLLLLVAAASAYALRDVLSVKPTSAGLLTTSAAVGDVEVTVLASGTVKPAKLVAVGAQVSGRVLSIPVRIGQVVRKGDLVAEIDSLTQQNTLRSADAALASTRAQREEKAVILAYAELKLDRQRTMLAQTAGSRADFETAEQTVKQTRTQIAQLDAQIAQAEVSVATARVNLGYTRITAPIDGTVLSVTAQEGQTLNAAQTTPTVAVIGQVDVMTVKAEISEADVVRMKVGQPLHFTILGDPDRRFEARVESIDPAPESVKNDSSFTSASTTSSSSSSSTSSSAIYYFCQFDVPNPDGVLRTYMTAQVVVVIGVARGVVTVPSAAVTPAATGRPATVRVIDDAGRVASREVAVGLDNKVTAEIVSGLAAGERVVTGQQPTSTTATSAQSGGGPPPPMGL